MIKCYIQPKGQRRSRTETAERDHLGHQQIPRSHVQSVLNILGTIGWAGTRGGDAVCQTSLLQKQRSDLLNTEVSFHTQDDRNLGKNCERISFVIVPE